VEHLVAQFQAAHPPGVRLLLLTLKSTATFYERHGFGIVADPTGADAALPLLLRFEFLVGSVVARLSRGPGTELVVMEWERAPA